MTDESIVITTYGKTEATARFEALRKAAELGWTDCTVQDFVMISEHYFKTKGGWRFTFGIDGTPPPTTGPPAKIVHAERPGSGGWSAPH